MVYPISFDAIYQHAISQRVNYYKTHGAVGRYGIAKAFFIGDAKSEVVGISVFLVMFFP